MSKLMKPTESDIRRIDLLIDRYFEAETTEAEERELRLALAATKCRSAKIDEARAVLGYLAIGRNEARRRRIFTLPHVAAAAAVAAVCAAVALPLMQRADSGADRCVAYVGRTEPKERIIQKVGQQLRINRSKLKDASDTNTDFDDIDSAIQSGYYLKQGLANNEDLYYMHILLTVTAPTPEDLEWKQHELKKLLLSQDMRVSSCHFREEQAFLSASRARI